MRLRSYAYPLYYPQYISGYERVRITTTTPTTIMETEQHIRKRFAFAMSSFGRLFDPPRITNEMRLMCKKWSEDTENPTPMHNDLYGVDRYFLDMWKNRFKEEE